MDQETFEKEASADAGRAESPSPAGRSVHEPGGPSAEGDRIAGQAPANASTNGQAAFSGENAPGQSGTEAPGPDAQSAGQGAGAPQNAAPNGPAFAGGAGQPLSQPSGPNGQPIPPAPGVAPAGQGWDPFGPAEVPPFPGSRAEPPREGPPPIVNRTQITLARLQQFNSTILKSSFVILLVGGILLAAFGLFFALLTAFSPEDGDWLLTVLFLFLGVFFLVLCYNIRRPQQAAFAQNQPAASCQPWNTYSCDYAGFTVWSQSAVENGATRYAWGALSGAREDEHNFYLQLSPQQAFIVAKDGFVTFDALSFRNLLRSVLGAKFREMKK